MAETAQTHTSVVFSPFLALQQLLEQSEAEIQQRLKQPLDLHDLLEEKKLIDWGEGTSAEISWDGKVKISQTAKKNFVGTPRSVPHRRSSSITSRRNIFRFTLLRFLCTGKQICF